MTLIDLGDFKLRFDPKEVRINIDGDLIDIGARRDDPSEFKCDDPHILPEINDIGWANPGLWKMDEVISRIDSKGIEYEIYPLSGLIDHPEWEVDTLILSPDGKERTYVHKKTKQRLTRSELLKRILNYG